MGNGNNCFKSCNKRIIIAKKAELNVEEIFKDINNQVDSNQKNSLFNSNKKSTYKNLPRNSSKNVVRHVDRIEKKNSNSNRLSTPRKLSSNRNNNNLDIRKKTIQENSFLYCNSDLSRGSQENENAEISKKNTIVRKSDFEDEEKEKDKDKEKIEYRNSDNLNLKISSMLEEINDKYAVLFLNEINNLRQNLSEYIDKIRKYKEFIISENGENYILTKHESFPGKSKLYVGEKAFDDTIDILQKKENLNKTKSLKKLELIKELKIPFPYNDIVKSKKITYVKSKFEELKVKLNGKYELTGYHLDISFKDIEFSTIMQLVDDNKGNKKRQLNLLNEENKYIGITCGEISNDRINVYFIFAK